MLNSWGRVTLSKTRTFQKDWESSLVLLSEQDSYLFKLNEHLVRPEKHRFGPTSSPFVPKT